MLSNFILNQPFISSLFPKFDFVYHNLIFFLVGPEIFLFSCIIFMLVIGSLNKEILELKSFKKFKLFKRIFFTNVQLNILILLLVALLYYNMDVVCFSTFSFMFISNKFIWVVKLFLSLFCVCFFFLVKYTYFKTELYFQFEFLNLILFIIISMFCLISSNDFLFFYLSIELQSLCLYILASFNYFKNFSVEAGVKYYILGSVASGIMIMSMSTIYLFVGITNFDDVLLFLEFLKKENDFYFILAFNVTFIFFLSGVLFKIGAFPFHLWIPDVYEGAPIYSTAFFAIISKISLFCFLIKMFPFFFSNLYLVFLLLGCCSLLFGSFGALFQNKIKRFIAYSAISHVGFILICLSEASLYSMSSAIFYVIIYTILNLNIFFIYFSLKNKKNIIYRKLTQLSYLKNSNFFMGICLTFLMFSFAGIPPLVGFYSKFFVFLSLIKSSNFFVIFFVIFITTLSAFYYIRIIKFTFFTVKKNYSFLENIKYVYSLFISLFFFINIFFFFFTNYLFIYLNESITNLFICL